MIHRECVVIHKLEDYNQIKKFVKKPYIDKDCIKTLKEKFGTKCKCIEIENPYYESDYLSSYYIFYAKKLQYFPKACYRLLFYADQQKEEFMGYITLRPTYDGRHIGKIYIEPKYLSTNQMSVILGNHKCHIGGSEAVIRIFPHMEQEGDIAVCAHVATWSVLRSFASRFHRYPEILLGEIVEMVSQQSERLIPTRGLTAFQISQIFLDAGFSPVVLSNSSKNSRLIKEAIISYIESGIPMVAVLTNRNHAISVVGLGPQLPSGSNNLRKRIDEIRPFESYFHEDKECTTKIVLSSRFYSSIVVNDDNFFPYAMVNTVPEKTDVNAVPYTIGEIDRLIIPLYSRIQLVYEDIRTIFLRYMDTHNRKNEVFIGRIFLTSANTFREYINDDCGALHPDTKAIILGLEMSRFIWCAEVSTPENYEAPEPLVNGLIIFDSTSATVNPDPFLFVALPNQDIKYKDTKRFLNSKIPVKDGLGIPRFQKNLDNIP